MQKIKDVLRLHLLGGVGSCRQLARAVGCGKSAVADCLRRAKVANLSTWALVAELDEAELSLPDWTKVREEMARADHQMTLALLWEEYKGQHPNGYRYSQFAAAHDPQLTAHFDRSGLTVPPKENKFAVGESHRGPRHAVAVYGVHCHIGNY